MCGIVGYVGNREAQSILLNGLKRLEYRGYDSAGVATVDDSTLHHCRSVGKVSGLEDKLSETPVSGTIGLAHTRWATHGAPNEGGHGTRHRECRRVDDCA